MPKPRPTIIAAHAVSQLEPGKKLLLVALTIAAIAAPIGAGLLDAPPSYAQSQPETEARLSFDVASVKPSTQPWMQIAPVLSPGRIRWTSDLTYMVSYAYRIPKWRISGTIPGSDHIFAIDATTRAGATDAQIRLMFQSLLAERFKMMTHRVSKEGNGYALTVAKGGPKIREAKDGEVEPLPEWFQNGIAAADLEGKVLTTIQTAAEGSITGRRASMLQLCEGLERVLQTFVLDETGLKGNYYFALRFAREDQNGETDAPTMFAGLQEKFGLKLERHKGPVETLVVDRIESTPTEN
jgi:uncharacterized protein (TIGR03435 family)